MRLITSFLSIVAGSHFRSGSFQFSQTADKDNDLILTRTLNYRRGFSGYTPACWQSHVLKEKRSDTMEYEHCLLQSDNSTCGVYDSTYLVTDIETQGFTNSQWCYGYADDKISKPTEPFEYYFQNCCWVDLTDDNGAEIKDGYFKLYAKFNRIDNNSPQVKVPPIWRIMTGCPDQSLYLNPSDKDGDRIKCRWSTKTEAKDGYHNGANFNSLFLDEDECSITYDGRKDSIIEGVKPIAIQIEDFDRDGNVKSSIPIQFLATVWQPLETGKSVVVARDDHRQILNDDEALFWGDIFSDHDHHEEFSRVTEFHPRDQGLSTFSREKRDSNDISRKAPTINPLTNLPFYCDEPPQLIIPSPAAGVELLVTGEITINLRAMYYENLKVQYNLKRYQYNSPQGMECTKIDGRTGRASCTWLPTLEQKQQMIHDFCFLAIDKFGRDTERRCITLKIVNLRNDVHSLLDLLAPPFAYRATNDYGCTGMGSLDPFVANAGPPVDEIDTAINHWKFCIRCAMDMLRNGTDTELPKYKFNEEVEICIDPVGTVERSICECDHQLALNLALLDKPNPKYQNYGDCKNQSAAKSYIIHELPSCCQNTQGFFKYYFGSQSCCESNGDLLNPGECLRDSGRPYEAQIMITRPDYIHGGNQDGKDTNSSKFSASGGKGGGNGNGGKGGSNKWSIDGSDKEGKI